MRKDMKKVNFIIEFQNNKNTLRIYYCNFLSAYFKESLQQFENLEGNAWLFKIITPYY